MIPVRPVGFAFESLPADSGDRTEDRKDDLRRSLHRRTGGTDGSGTSGHHPGIRQGGARASPFHR
jgi:hypothetical protein